MNAPLLPGVLLLGPEGAQINIPLASDGVLRYVLDSRYGSILVEVQGNAIFVNGQRVEP